MEFPVSLDLLLRWTHFVAGIVWVGHNYSSLVQRPTWQAYRPEELADSSSPRLAALIRREHGFFRWASVVTWLAGIGMLLERGWLPDALTLQSGLAPLGLGMYLGTVMMANVWLVLWPHQKKVLGLVPASIDERLRCTRITHLSSRTNTMLSIPLLFLMAAGGHGGIHA